MVKPERSCLVEKLSAFIDLNDVDSELLAELEKNQQHFSRNQEVWNIDDAIENLYVVRKGWLVSYTILQDGRRQVLELHYPGDLVGAPEVPFRHFTSNLVAVEDCVLCPFPKAAIDIIFSQSPRLTALIFTLAMIEKAVNLDRLRVLGRMSARERLAHILLEIHSRLSLTKGVLDESFRLPLSQHDLADAVGLTNVSISNAFTKLEKDGLVERDKKHLQILDLKKMIQISDFVDRYREVDISWFPQT